jgi:hypothetical protein
MAEEAEGQESRNAVAEAAASLKGDPTFQQAATELVRGDDAPATPPSPEPEPPAEPAPEPGEQEGRATEPAVTPPASDDDAGEDYDPEAHADYGEDELTAEPVKPVVTEEPLAPTPPATSTEEEMREFREFQEFRRQREASQPPATPEPEAPRPGQQPTQEDLKGVIQELIDADGEMQRAVGNLQAIGTTVQTNRKQLETYGEESQKIQAEYVKAEAALAVHQEMAKDADIDADFMAPKIQQAQQALNELSSRQSRLMIEAERLERQTLQLEGDYRDGVQTINRAGLDEWNSRIRQEQEQTEYEGEYEAATKEWNEVVPRITKDWGLDPSLEPIVKEELSRLSERASDDDLARLEPWMRSKRETVMGRFDQIRKASLRRYAEDKQADTTQPAPPPERASAPPKTDQPAPLSSKDADRLAHRNLIQRLRGEAR